MRIEIDISKDRYDEIMSMDWKNCRLIFAEEIRAIHDGKVLEQEPKTDCDKCAYSTKNGECQYDDIAETIPTEQEPKTDYKSFCEWVAEEIIDEENWKYNADAFPEIACRKLHKLGIMNTDGKRWIYENEALEQEPCGDCISRQYLVEKAVSWDKHFADSERYVSLTDIQNAPPVNPQEPKTGHWEWVQYDYNPKLGNWHCSECRCVVVECVGKEEKGGIPLYKYCPSCGCCMVEPHESEKINCKSTKCENCINHNYCDYEPQESEE